MFSIPTTPLCPKHSGERSGNRIQADDRFKRKEDQRQKSLSERPSKRSCPIPEMRSNGKVGGFDQINACRAKENRDDDHSYDQDRNDKCVQRGSQEPS